MKGQAQAPGVSYLIPSRTTSGSREEMVAEIDDVVRGLLGLRQLISMHDAGVGLRRRAGRLVASGSGRGSTRQGPQTGSRPTAQ